MYDQKYRIKDIEERIDRDKTTIIRWEKEGMIPAAKRDSRGWRYYSKEEMQAIVNRVLSSNYFRHMPGRANA